MNERSPAPATLLFAAVMMAVVAVSASRRPAELEHLAASQPITYRIDPNTAEASTLCLLPSIGPGIAERIIGDREANGPFVSTADMRRVPYVGEKTAAAMAPWVTLERGGD